MYINKVDLTVNNPNQKKKTVSKIMKYLYKGIKNLI